VNNGSRSIIHMLSHKSSLKVDYFDISDVFAMPTELFHVMPGNMENKLLNCDYHFHLRPFSLMG
jgi:hypothetical protein